MVGYAFMGKAHSTGYMKAGVFFPELSAKPVMTAICGRNEPKVKEAAGQYGWKSHETDWKKLVARPDIDLIDVSTPNNSHAEISIAAAKAGKHVFCEKPLAMTLSEAKEMRDACNQAKVVCLLSRSRGR
jgi:predicted dehydrogenase